jgi:hypothetical protein
VATTAKNPCVTRVIQCVLFMCVYPLTDRTDNRMRRPPIHNKRTFSLTVKENLMGSSASFRTMSPKRRLLPTWYTSSGRKFRLHQTAS